MADENDKETNDDDVVVMEDSPTVFNEKKLPKTIKSNQFISVITTTHTLRTKVFKPMKNVERIVVQITSMEQGEVGEAQEDFLDGLYGDIQKEYGQLKGRVKDHEELTSQIRTMAGYIERSNSDSTQPMALKTKWGTLFKPAVKCFIITER